VAGIAEQPGDAKVGELDGRGTGRILGKQKIGRLQVAMHDAAVVGRFQGPGDLGRHRDGFPPVEPAPLLEEFLEARAPHEFHREERPPFLLAEGQQPDDPRMLERLEGLDLGRESPPQARVVAEVGRQGLDRHRGSVRIDGFVDRAHAAPTETSADRIRSESGGLHAPDSSPNGPGRQVRPR
jgi:hypothetical protein